MPYEDVSAFIGDLREMVDISPSVRFVIIGAKVGHGNGGNSPAVSV
jgi:hypothetical protein